jgi:hypothetical protein
MVKEAVGQTVPHVYEAIAQVMARLSKDGIGKDRRNESQGYAFRGIDDVYNALAPILSDVGLCILPAVKSREVVERATANGRTVFYVNVDVDFAFVSSKDGSSHIVSMPGEAMDSGDKATNKAMSAAYKYAAFQAFAIPTEGDNDADAHTYDVAPTIIEPDSMTELFAAIESATTEDELKLAYKIAYAACDGNKAWQIKVIAAKDKAKPRVKV